MKINRHNIFKWALIFSILNLFINYSKSQTITYLEIIPSNPTIEDEIKVISSIFFPFGVGDACPPLEGYFWNQNDTIIIVDAFYNVSGFWPAYGCYSDDTIKLGYINSGNYILFFNSNLILDSDTTFEEDIDTINFSINNAQSYYPFPDSNAIWSEIFISTEGYGGDIDTVIFYRYGLMNEDTVINSIKYNKLFLLSDTTLNIDSATYYGAIREDSLKRVYFIDDDCINEVLIYDFSKDIGDTIAWYDTYYCGAPYYGYYSMVIYSIDSILIKNKYRKTYYFHPDPPYEPYWIEGIGSTRGLFSPITPQPANGDQWKLICFKQEDTLLYLNTDYNSCFPLAISIENDIKKTDYLINIFPNPLSDVLIIKTSKYKNLKLKIFNVLGKKIYEKEIKTNYNEIDLSFLTKGLYILSFYNNDKFILRKKLIKR